MTTAHIPAAGRRRRPGGHPLGGPAMTTADAPAAAVQAATACEARP